MNVATKAPILRGKRTTLSPIDTSLLVLAPFAVVVYNLYYHPFSPFPGLFMASTGSSWLTWEYDSDLEDLEPLLHEEYGPIVRISPNIISVNDPNYVKEISIQANPPHWWLPFGHEGVNDVFFVPPPGLHAEWRKCSAPTCSVGMVGLWEGVVDCRVREWAEKLKAKYGSSEAHLDLSEWARHLSVDLVGLVVFGVDMGCTQNREDNKGRTPAFESELENVGVLAELRTIYRTLTWNSFIPNISGEKADREGPEALRVKAGLIIDTAWMSREKSEAGGEEWHLNSEYATQAVTMLEKAMSAKNSEGTRFTKEEVLTKCFPPFLASKDSIAFAITNTLKLLFTNPRVLATLLSELATYYWQKPLSEIPPWTDIEDQGTRLPYLSAVLHESLRFNPAFLMSFPRIVTSSGTELTHRNCLYTLPGGLQIYLNPIVICRNRRIFGEDVHHFCPERWLEGTREKIERMKTVGFGWGAGSSDCFGKALAQMIVAKAVVTVLRNFEVELPVGYSSGDVWNLGAMGGSSAAEFWAKVKSKEWPGAEGEMGGPSEHL
ncbi:cytochrome P450 [Tuber borchii]|uniref:Cytochrome P450 n=1 Tax=Tuber borchii TaxID=42251 RepID=A0A2T6ZWE7_TUBBO|nr:cytochrome P450 [Tuber borchii]